MVLAAVSAITMTAQNNAVRVLQGTTSDWYKFEDYEGHVRVAIDGINPVFPGDKTYDIKSGTVSTAFGKDPSSITRLDSTPNTDKPSVIKVLKSGRLYILYDQKVFNAQGVLVREGVNYHRPDAMRGIVGNRQCALSRCQRAETNSQ